MNVRSPVLADPPPAAAKVIVSLLAFVVMVMFVPPTNVRLSVEESATTLSCPDTAIVLNTSFAADELMINAPDESVSVVTLVPPWT